MSSVKKDDDSSLTMDNYETCLQCQTKAIIQTKNCYSVRTCKNNHSWRKCYVHNTRCEGEYSHLYTMTGMCQCGKYFVEHHKEFIIDRENGVMTHISNGWTINLQTGIILSKKNDLVINVSTPTDKKQITDSPNSLICTPDTETVKELSNITISSDDNGLTKSDKSPTKKRKVNVK